jgi:ribosome-associated translation inhibitor RaiA
MENMMIKFQGFHPSDFTRSYLDEKLATLQEVAPKGAHMEAVFTRDHSHFKGIVTIFSPAGKFFAVANGTKLKEVTHKINEQIRKQLHRWKEKSHRKESLKDFSNDLFNLA